MKVESARFVGVQNGRPRFDYPDGTAAPDWLLKLANAGEVKDGVFIVKGKPMAPGTVVRGD